MEIDTYSAELEDIPFIIEQMKQASKIHSRAKPLYPGDDLAKVFVKNMINTQVVFMTKGLKEGFAYNDEFGVCKILADGKYGCATEMISLITEFDEDPWIRTGVMIGMIYPHLYNPDIIVGAVIIWWVANEYRGGRSGFKLLDIFLDFVEEKVDEIYFGIEAQSTVNPRILTKRGFRVKETHYIKEV